MQIALDRYIRVEYSATSMMSRSLKSQAIPLYVIAKEAILEMIKDSSFPDNRLPSEADLSEKLRISRTTIREALIALQREGVITKQHGLGNRIHQSTLETRMQIDRYSDFKGLIRDGGYTAKVERSEPEWVDNPAAFGIEDPEDNDDEKYLKIESMYTADGKPAILSRNFIKSSLFHSDSKLDGSYRDSSFVELMNEFSKEEVANTIISFKPSIAGKNLAAVFEITEGDPLMQWQETSYSVMDRVICLGRIIFHPELINLTLLRKWR